MKLVALHIETERLLLRPYVENDALALKEAIDASLVSLRRFMPWAHFEPTSKADKLALIREWTNKIEQDLDYTLGIFHKEKKYFIGSTGFHKRSEKGIFEIGYWQSTQFEGNGYISEACKALCSFAFQHLQAEKIEIKCLLSNTKSAAIPNRLGFTLEYTYRTLQFNEEGQREKQQCWVLFKEDWKL